MICNNSALGPRPPRPRPYLGRNVIGRAAEGFGGLVAADALFTHAEVGDFYVPVLVQQHVVQLQVPVDDPSRVQVEEADGDLGRVESGSKVTN